MKTRLAALCAVFLLVLNLCACAAPADRPDPVRPDRQTVEWLRSLRD